MKKQIALLLIPLIFCGCAKKNEQIPQSDAQSIPQAVTAPAEAAPEPAWSEAHRAALAAETPEEQLKYYRQAVEEGWEEDDSIQQAQEALLNLHAVALPGIANARDLGGYRTADGHTVKAGLLLRTAQLSGAEESAAAALEALPLRRIVDFRDAVSRDAEPDIEIPGAQYHSLPIVSNPPGLVIEKTDDRMSMIYQYAQQSGMHVYYPFLVEDADNQAVYRAFFEQLLDADGAVLWHCSQGKDRAGMAAVLILSALGVERDTILEDFALSALAYDSTYEKMAAAFPNADEETMRHLHGILSVDRENMQIALEVIDNTYGGMEAYLHNQMGLSEENLSQLRQMYLE